MEFDYSKLRGRIVEKFGNISQFSKELKITRTSVNMKLNNRMNFTRSDMIEWSRLLDIPKDELGC